MVCLFASLFVRLVYMAVCGVIVVSTYIGKFWLKLMDVIYCSCWYGLEQISTWLTKMVSEKESIIFITQWNFLIDGFIFKTSDGLFRPILRPSRTHMHTLWGGRFYGWTVVVVVIAVVAITVVEPCVWVFVRYGLSHKIWFPSSSAPVVYVYDVMTMVCACVRGKGWTDKMVISFQVTPHCMRPCVIIRCHSWDSFRMFKMWAR